MNRQHPDDTIDGLQRLAPYSITAACVLGQRMSKPLRLDRRGDRAAAQLLEQLGPIETARWVNALLAEVDR